MSDNLLSNFFIKYLTNAKEAAKDTLTLDAAQNKLTAGIKEQTAEEKKRNQELEKTAKAMSDLVVNITSAAAAYIGLNAVRAGVAKSADFNNTLALESKLLGQNAQDISALGGVMQQFGGTAEGFQGWLHSLTMEYGAMGRELPAAEKILRSINRELQGQDAGGQRNIFARYGIGDPAMQAALLQTPEQLDKMIEKQKELRPVTENMLKVNREWSQAMSDVHQAISSVFDKIGEAVLPGLTWVIEKITNLITNHREWAAALTAVATILTTVIGLIAGSGLIGALSGAIPLVGKIATAFGAVATALRAIAVVALANPVVLAILGLGAAAYGGYKAYQHLTAGETTSSGANGGMSTPARTEAAMKAFKFWKSQGYTDAQSAGWVANMLAESGGNSGARGDGGRASGLFQWHPDRVQGILSGTGIDVRNASFEDQLTAASWEAEQRGDAHLIRQAGSARDAGAIISKKFERPANGDYEARKRGEMAAQAMLAAQQSLNVADTSSVGSRGNSTSISNSRSNQLNVGGITVSSNASDPQAVAQMTADIVGKQYQDVISNYDDAGDF